jgi:hypothetical protein
VAYIRYTNGKQACMPSGNPTALYDLREYGIPNGIRIDSSAVCGAAVSKLAPATQSN